MMAPPIFQIKGLFILAISLVLSMNSHATPQSPQQPDKMLEASTIKMLHSINKNRAEIQKSPDKLRILVENIILPHLDFITASKLVMGKYWRRADKKQKIRFIRQFRHVLLRFYSSAVSEYLSDNDEILEDKLIKYSPLILEEGETNLTVKALLKPKKGAAISIYYRVHLTKKGWKVYDISVEGISMITTYKNNFASPLRNEGIDALNASLEQKNKEILAKNKYQKKTH